jgi:hypothetical protein
MTSHKSFIVALAAALALTPAAKAPAFSLSDLDPTRLLNEIVDAVTEARVNVHNYYDFPIRVVMDNGRETHVIAPGGVATFDDANIGDHPTFHALNAKNGRFCPEPPYHQNR